VPQDVLTLGTMATQNANAVAITGGSIGGSTAVSVTPQPSGQAIQINDGAAGAMYGLYSRVQAGTGRYNLFVDGTAPNYLVGPLGIGVPAAGSYLLDVLGVTRMQSRLEVGPVSTGHAVTIGYNAASTAGIWMAPSGSATGTAIYFTNTSAGIIGSISTTASATAFNTSSDVRLKHAVQALSGALAAIQALRPVAFRWNVDESQDEGFLAHELQQVLPHAVTGEPDAVNADGSIKPQQVDHSKLVVWLCGAVQELTQRVTSLEEQLGI
jgi:hypothetical protein